MERIGYYLNPDINDITDVNATLKFILSVDVNVSITIGDIRLKSDLNINQTLIFTKRSFFYTKPVFIPLSQELCVILKVLFN